MENQCTGLMRVLSGQEEPMTVEKQTFDMQKIITDTMQSMWDGDLYEQDKRRQVDRAKGEILLNAALAQEIISQVEHFYLISSLYINGALIVSSDMYDRLQKVIDRE